MRPILFIIPPLSHHWFLTLLVLVGLVAVVAVLVGTLRLQRDPNGSSAIMSWLCGVALAAGVAAVLIFAWGRAPIQLHSYGLFLVLGFFVAAWVACREAQRRGYDPNLILDLALPMLFVCIAFCRMVYVVLNSDQFHSVGSIFRVWDGGLSFHGIFIGAPLVVWFFARRHNAGFGNLCDVIAPSVFLGYVFGRIGCFMNGCCYGYACALPWAVQFPDENNRNILTLPSHPTQLYSAAIALVLFFVMQRARLMPRFNQFPGQITLLFFGLYAVERFFIEIFRNGATGHPIFGISWLTTAQFVSIIGLIAIAALWKVLLHRALSHPQSARRSSSPPSEISV